MSLQKENVPVTISGVITAYETRGIQIRSFSLFLLSGIISWSPINGAEPLVEAANNTANCRKERNPEVRLACFDAASEQLTEVLNLKNIAKRIPEPKSPLPDSHDAVLPQETSDNDLPTWATAPRAPQFTKDEHAQDSDSFKATIVRITRNKSGRHRFYTEDGAVWQQTQKVDVRPPKSLPAVAQFRRKLSGSPTIKFDVSNRSYRVRRIN